MIMHHVGEIAPKELRLDATLSAPRAAVWRCWTQAALLKEWYCPKPWRVSSADLDVRPGGRFNTVFAGPNGERVENAGSFLEAVPLEKLTFTDAYIEGFIPAETHFMTGYVELSDAPGDATHMIWGARHVNDDDTKKHLAMGFADGWKAAAGQLEELAKSLG